MKRTDAAAVVGHDYRMHKLPLRMVPWQLYLELAPAFRLKVGGELPHKKASWLHGGIERVIQP